MQSAEVYLELVRQRGKQGLPLERVYRQLFNRELYLLAYGKIYRNKGALTPGTNQETVDGMSLAKIESIIEALRYERYHWTPVRRIYIEKRHSKKLRPLGLPSWSDKLLQEVIRLILTAFLEPNFSEYSHGFRPGRGCHTALHQIYDNWAGTTWFLEGDISSYFDTINHEKLLEILSERIQDERFIRLIHELLKAGYLEEWKWGRTFSGTPQGSILSPILSNAYLDRLDKFVETILIPKYTRGKRRRHNTAYVRLSSSIRRLRQQGKIEVAKTLHKQRKRLPSIDPNDPDYRRLRYYRYADDFLLGFIGSKREVEEIKVQLGEFLHKELKLELSEPKTLITHARTQAAKFLGYEISTFQQDDANEKAYLHRRVLNGKVELALPTKVVREKCQHYMVKNLPVHRKELTNNSVFNIIAQYQSEYRGIVEYYRLAHNLSKLRRLKWVMEQSLVKTLTVKLKLSVARIYEKFQTTLWRDQRSYKGLQEVIKRGEEKPPLVAQWGGIALKRRMDATLKDETGYCWSARTDLVKRLLADKCELCGSQQAVQVHHIRALKDLNQPGKRGRPAWMKVMSARQRKTLVLCQACHHSVHSGNMSAKRTSKPENSLTGKP